MPQGMEVRQEVKDTLAPRSQQKPGAIVPLAPVMSPIPSTMRAVGEDMRDLQKALTIGMEYADKKFQASLKEDFVRGQLAQQEGKTLEEAAGMFSSTGFVSGFKSMQAQTLADKMYAEATAKIESGDYATDPATYREGLVNQFKGILTGDDETDRYLTQVSVDMTSKLVRTHTLAHEKYKIDETVNSGVDLLVSKAKLADANETDADAMNAMLNFDHPANPLHGLDPILRRQVLTQAVARSLDEGSDALLKAVQRGRAVLGSHADIAEGNIDLSKRPTVKNADGSISTVRSMSFNDGQSEVLVPTVSDDGRILTNDEAVAEYKRTGRHLGKFSTPEKATAYAKSLHTQQEQAYGDGLSLEGLGLNSAQQSEIRAAYKRWETKKQNAFNRDLETSLYNLSQSVADGKMTLDSGLDRLEELRAQYGKDDQFMHSAARTLFSGATHAKAKAEAERESAFDPALAAEVHDLSQAATHGGMPYETAIKHVQDISKRYGLSGPQTKALAAGVTGDVDQFWRNQMSDLQAQAKKAQAEQEKLSRIDTAVQAGQIAVLDPSERQIGLSMAYKREIVEPLQRMLQDPNYTAEDARAFGAKTQAGVLSRFGVVDDDLASSMTSTLLSTDPGGKGKMSASATNAMYTLVEMNKVNPELAMRHLKSPETQAVGTMALRMVEAGEPIESALQTAYAQYVQGARPRDTANLSSEERNQIVSRLGSALTWNKQPNLVPLTPGFHDDGRWRRESWYDTKVREPNERLIAAASEVAEGLMLRNDKMNPADATAAAVNIMDSRYTIIYGNTLISRGDLAQKFDLPGMPTGKVADAIDRVVQQYGKEWWGADGQWNDPKVIDRADGILDIPSTIATYVGTKVRQAWRGVPQMQVSYDDVTGMVSMAPLLNDGTYGTPKLVPATMIGRWYKQHLKNLPVGDIVPRND